MGKYFTVQQFRDTPPPLSHEEGQVGEKCNYTWTHCNKENTGKHRVNTIPVLVEVGKSETSYGIIAIRNILGKTQGEYRY